MRTSAPSASPGASSRVLTIPNALSAVRLATVPIFVWLFVTDRENLGVAIYAGAAWTDFFDGYIARRTGTVTELGKLLDPLADRVAIIALAVALVATSVLPAWLAGAVILRDVVILASFPWFERKGLGRIPVNFAGKSATAALLFGLGSLAISETSFVLAGVGEPVGITFTVMGAVLYWVAGGMYAREAATRLSSKAAA